MEMTEEQYLAHYGILRRSGRYPWGSGGPEENTGPGGFLETVQKLRKQGMTNVEIAQGMGTTVAKLRAAYSIANNERRASDIAQAQALRDKGMSLPAIAERMYGSRSKESTVRAMLDPAVKDRVNILNATTSKMKEHIDENGPVDIGVGMENWMGISNSKLKTAVAHLEEEGYKVYYNPIPQLGNPGKFTSQMVLCPPGMTWNEMRKSEISTFADMPHSPDGGRSYLNIKQPLSIDSSRVDVRYKEEGGADADGVIYVRPGVPDCSLGGSRYAQVRIQVDDTHFIKGMAIYKEDLPHGVDLMFNTNKSNTGNKLDALKPIKKDPDNPFGSTIKEFKPSDLDEHGHPKTVMNKVYEEGDWENWSRSLSSQFLSKQAPVLAKTQLDLTQEQRKNTFDEIMSLTNPVVKQHLLEKFADETDAAAVHLKAAKMPRQSNHVILPMDSLKPNEVYAPAFDNGERVVLVRHPHGGPFEIPELVVNNNHPPARRTLGDVQDAIAIHPRVAERLSGADFDGDTVLVIPNRGNRVKTKPPLEGLKDFDPKAEYPAFHGMKTIDGGTWNAHKNLIEYPEGKKSNARGKQIAMGDISNLITDMTLKGASNDELARAVRHSMVVIDAEKHVLNYRESARRNGISKLKEDYQGGARSGASTLISKAKSQARPNERKQSFRIDPVTGKKTYFETGSSYVDAKGKTVVRTDKSKKLAETDNAFTLVSPNGGTIMENLYATHSNALKAMANDARKAMVNTKANNYNPSANKAYAKEVASLRDKLDIAEKNRPLERHAQALANATVAAKKAANPGMDELELKKLDNQALAAARVRTGANKKERRVEITADEWKAIQAGAISPTRLKKILDNTDIEMVKDYATPKSHVLMSPTKKRSAQAMINNGYTMKEAANQLGVSLSTLKRSLSEEG